MSVTKDQTTPHDDAPNAAGKWAESATNDHTTLQDDDASVATVRAALAGGTAGSFKKSLNTCLIIWTVGRSQMPRRRIWIHLTWITPIAALVAHYWHAIFSLVHVLH